MIGAGSETLPFFCLLVGLFRIGGRRIDLKEGDKAPDFALPSQDGNAVHLSDFHGKNVILYFYPKDDTPGCTKEACGFRDAMSLFKELKTEILGVSTDAVESHKQFQKKHGLNFSLLADPDEKVTKLYGVKTLLGLAERVTFVIDRDGIIRKVFPRVDVSQHSAELVEFVRQLESGSSSKK
jgi:peroxiredoxin Q/BCP